MSKMRIKKGDRVRVISGKDAGKEGKILCVQVKGGSFRKVGTVGDVIVGAVREAAPNGNIKKGDVVKAVIVRTKKEIRRRDGSYVRFDDNAAVVIDNNGDPKGTRIFGPVARELREKKYMRIVSLAPEVV